MMEEAELIASKVSLTLELPPSCVQFCPAHPSYFVVGTYNLEKEEQSLDTDIGSEEIGPRKPQNRNGSLLLYKLTPTDELTLVQTLLQPSAILDIRFHPKKPDILAIVSSTATLAVVQLDVSSESPLTILATSSCQGSQSLDADVLFLQCNWHPLGDYVIGVTTSTGLARLLLLDEEWRIQQSRDLQVANSLEAWCIAFSPPGRASSDSANFSIYCGGDDSILRYAAYESRPPKPSEQLSSPMEISDSFHCLHETEVTRQHDAGVTAILPLAIDSRTGGRLIVTGSYDDHIRLFTIHDLDTTYGMRKMQLLADCNLGGGVWRLDLIDDQAGSSGNSIRILASCMHAGARVIEFRVNEIGDWTCMVLARFEEHKSMNYGSDYRRTDQVGPLKVISTSFYDRLLCLWEFVEP